MSEVALLSCDPHLSYCFHSHHRGEEVSLLFKAMPDRYGSGDPISGLGLHMRGFSRAVDGRGETSAMTLQPDAPKVQHDRFLSASASTR